MKIYYTYSNGSAESDVIIAADGLAWDFQEDLCDPKYYDSDEDRRQDTVARLIRWRDMGILEDIFSETSDAAKYPASEIFTRFPDAIEL